MRLPHRQAVIPAVSLVGLLSWAALSVSGQSPREASQPGEWRTYNGRLDGSRYSPLDQIDASNFSRLEVAWRFKTDNLGPRPEFNLQSTPLVVNGMLYSTGRHARARLSHWMPAPVSCAGCIREDEGARAAAAPRQLSGRGLCLLERRR